MKPQLKLIRGGLKTPKTRTGVASPRKATAADGAANGYSRPAGSQPGQQKEWFRQLNKVLDLPSPIREVEFVQFALRSEGALAAQPELPLVKNWHFV